MCSFRGNKWLSEVTNEDLVTKIKMYSYFTNIKVFVGLVFQITKDFDLVLSPEHFNSLLDPKYVSIVIL